jgi:hypothetical protein
VEEVGAAKTWMVRGWEEDVVSGTGAGSWGVGAGAGVDVVGVGVSGGISVVDAEGLIAVVSWSISIGVGSDSSAGVLPPTTGVVASGTALFEVGGDVTCSVVVSPDVSELLTVGSASALLKYCDICVMASSRGVPLFLKLRRREALPLSNPSWLSVFCKSTNVPYSLWPGMTVMTGIS